MQDLHNTITPEGESPQPVREASAGPGQNPWRPGPKARRRHQPSPAKAGVNLREYSPAPPRSRSRPRHRRPTTTLAPKGETTHYDLCVALLLQIMFAVHAEGVSKRAPTTTLSPKGAVKPKNLPAGRPVKLKNPHARQGVPKGAASP